MVGFNIGKPKKNQPAAETPVTPSATSASGEKANEAAEQLIANLKNDRKGTEVTDRDAATAIEGTPVKDPGDPDTSETTDTAETAANNEPVDFVAAVRDKLTADGVIPSNDDKPGTPNGAASVHRKTEKLGDHFSQNGQDNDASDNEATTAGPQPQPQPDADPEDKKTAEKSKTQQAPQSDKLDDFLKTKSDKYKKFMRQLGHTYGGVYLPDAPTAEFDKQIDSLVITSQIKKPLLSLSRDFSIATKKDKEYRVSKTGVFLEKKQALNESKAHKMALLIYMNPAAHTAGVTLEGTPSEQRLLYAALRNVMALNPDGPTITIHNGPAQEAAPIPITQETPNDTAEQQPGGPGQYPDHLRTQPQPESSPTESASKVKPESEASPLSKEMTVQKAETPVTEASAPVKPAPDSVETPQQQASPATTQDAFKSAVGKKWEPSEQAIAQAATYVRKTEDATLGSLSEKFGIGTTKARKLMGALEENGVVERESDHKTAGWKLVNTRKQSSNGAEAHIG